MVVVRNYKKMITSSLFFLLLSFTGVVQAIDSSDFAWQQFDRQIAEIQRQKDNILQEIVDAESPSLLRTICINAPKFALKHVAYLLGAAVIGTGIVLVVNNDGLERIRDGFLESEGFFGFFTKEAAKDVIKNPQFWGKTVLSFILSYLSLYIVFEYLLTLNDGASREEKLNKLAMLLERHEQKLKELKVILLK